MEKRLTFTIWLLSSSELEALRVSVCACGCGQVWGGEGDGKSKDSETYFTLRTVLFVFICNDKHISMHVPVPFAGTV